MPRENPLFHTLKGYELLEFRKITYAMEDYLEMILRCCQKQGYTRTGTLAKTLNVQPSSVSKMLEKLKAEELIDFEHYGVISLTEKGQQLGEYLLFRHRIVHDFFCVINQTEDELELTEKIEHYLDQRTVLNLAQWLTQLKDD